MKKYLFMLLALCLMPANNTAQILNSLKDIIRPTDPSLIRTLNGQWDFYFTLIPQHFDLTLFISS